MNIRHRLNQTGIGYAGIDGVWWRPAVQPFALPAHLAAELTQIGQAIFLLFDTITTLYGSAIGAAGGLNQLLEHKVPPSIPRLTSSGRLLGVRPDFQLYPTRDGRSYQLVATELEICPSAHGFAHAMQVAYGLPTDLVEIYARFLGGRSLLFAGAEQWSEFLFEQLAFCRGLSKLGVPGHVLFDRPLQTLAAQVQAKQRWQPPLFGVISLPTHWNDDVLGRIQQHGLQPFLWPDDHHWPEVLTNTVVFRFGYFDCFEPARLAHFVRWQANGVTLLNPTSYFLESKVLMATLGLPVVQQHIQQANSAALAILRRALPETCLLTSATLPRLMAEQAQWVVKFAGYDNNNQAWGGRSLQIGEHHSPAAWRQHLLQSLELPWPVVAQRLTPSLQVDIEYIDEAGQRRWLPRGTTRLRSFFLREPNQQNGVLVGGSHLTVVAGSSNVAEGTTAVQAPVVFHGW
jgi:hypothetical protein